MDHDPKPLVGIITGGVVALLIWIGCTAGYGFLGFALGWMPAAIVGGIVGLLTMLFWPFILLFLGVLVAVIAYLAFNH